MTTTTPVVRLAADKNIDKSITAARTLARRDGVTVIIEKGVARRDGSIRRIPILEVSPKGDVWEVPAPALRVSIAQRLTEVDINRRIFGMNARAAAGHERLDKLVSDSRNYLAAAAEHARTYRQQQQHTRNARANRNTTAMLDGKHAA